METKGIDLTQCNNCRFRAVVDGKEVTGRIEKSKTSFLLTGDDVFGCVVSYLELATLRGETDLITDDGGFRISGFEIVPRDPETYKDWQVGDIIGFEDENGEIDIIPEHLCRVIFRSGELVAIADNCEDADINGVYTCSQLYRECCRLVLTDIEKRIIEERKKAEDIPKSYEFKKGEPVLVRDDNIYFWRISTFEKMSDNKVLPYITNSGQGTTYPYKYCIPYNENTMHLLGTTEDYKEE